MDQPAQQVDYSEYYQAMLEESEEYMDWLCQRLMRYGIVLQNMCSKKGQLKCENLLGLEIKYQKAYKATRNIWIEVREKKNLGIVDFVISGIYKCDNSWLLGCGDYQEFFLFTKKHLQRFHASLPPERTRLNNKNTGMGFLMSRSEAMEECERMFTFSG